MNPQDADFLDPAARDVVTVTGPDAGSYLQSQIAQEIRPMGVGDVRWTLVLEPSGRVNTLARITRTGDTTFELDTDAGFGAALKERLEKFKIRVDATVELLPADRSEPSVEHEGRRIEAGWPRMGAEILPGETIPAATAVAPLAVDYAKGCYPGQELVERMDSRGADAPRTLRLVAVDDGAEPGDPIVDALGEEVGSVTSVSGSTALGYVKRGSEVGRPPAHAG
jgi:hypothetical protein